MADWKTELQRHFESGRGPAPPSEAGAADPRIPEFFEGAVRPAFEELGAELVKFGREIQIEGEGNPLWFQVCYRGANEFRYGVYVLDTPGGPYPLPISEVWERGSGKLLRGEGLFRLGAQNYGVGDIGKEELIRHFIRSYLGDANPS